MTDVDDIEPCGLGWAVLWLWALAGTVGVGVAVLIERLTRPNGGQR
ncbi:MAG: hypothetical protein LC798_07075 [Chloroflexi bacterium]|nr:hypothetical protein [Chloroflexota bacterium]